MMVFLFGNYLFLLGKQGIESWVFMKQKDFEMNHYKKAWNYLYRNESKFKTRMDSAWVKSW